MRRRLAIVGLILLVPAGALVGWWFTPEPAIGQANFDRIEIGMTKADVQTILGSEGSEVDVSWFGEKDQLIWLESRCAIVVTFDRGEVKDKRLNSRTLVEQAEDWYAGQPWHPLLGRSTFRSFRGSSVGPVVR